MNNKITFPLISVLWYQSSTLRIDFPFTRFFLIFLAFLIFFSSGSQSKKKMANKNQGNSAKVATEGSVSVNTPAMASILISSTDYEVQLNPYMLHHSIAPTTTLITQQLVGASNYVSWSKVMLLALSGKNKLGFFNGTIKKTRRRSVLGMAM